MFIYHMILCHMMLYYISKSRRAAATIRVGASGVSRAQRPTAPEKTSSVFCLCVMFAALALLLCVYVMLCIVVVCIIML